MQNEFHSKLLKATRGETVFAGYEGDNEYAIFDVSGRYHFVVVCRAENTDVILCDVWLNSLSLAFHAMNTFLMDEYMCDQAA